MTYIPSNRTKTNLYTNGTKYQIKSTGVVYVGPYWEKYTGEIFTGKNPNETPSQQLVPINIPSNNALADKTSYSFMEIDDIPKPLVVEYLNIKNIDFTTQTKNLPISYYPKPTEDDYNLGAFTRYFCVKVNENIYLEISKDTYDALNSQKGDWLWELYIPFQLIWTISGEEKEVEKTNYNITIIQEKRLKRRGLTQFLRNNYLKFYPSPYTTEDVMSPTTEIPIKKDKPSIKDLFEITKSKLDPRLIITPEEIENARKATPTVTSSIGNPLTGIKAVFDPNQNKKKGS